MANTAYTTDNEEQLKEMMYYFKYLSNSGHRISPEIACRNWIHKYAKRWREIREQGISDPSTIIRKEYMMVEDQYKWASGRTRRSQTAFRSAFGRSRSFGGVLAERLDEIFSR